MELESPNVPATPVKNACFVSACPPRGVANAEIVCHRPAIKVQSLVRKPESNTIPQTFMASVTTDIRWISSRDFVKMSFRQL